MSGERTTAKSEGKARLERRVRVASAAFLASSLVHDLSQPISAINAWTAACRAKAERDPHVQEALGERIGLLADEAARATRTLRDFKHQLPPSAHELAEVELAELLAEVVALLREDAAAADADLRLAADDASCRVLTDPELVQMALYILCRNALDALGHAASPGEVVVRLQAVEAKAQVRVEDSGPGVREDVRPRLFEPFVTDRPHGLGLGLAVCRRAIESVGGRIWYEAQSFQGATFAFELPREPVNTDVWMDPNIL